MEHLAHAPYLHNFSLNIPNDPQDRFISSIFQITQSWVREWVNPLPNHISVNSRAKIKIHNHSNSQFRKLVMFCIEEKKSGNSLIPGYLLQELNQLRNKPVSSLELWSRHDFRKDFSEGLIEFKWDEVDWVKRNFV